MSAPGLACMCASANRFAKSMAKCQPAERPMSHMGHTQPVHLDQSIDNWQPGMIPVVREVVWTSLDRSVQFDVSAERVSLGA